MPISFNRRVITPVDPRITMKAKASGAPPKFVDTSERAINTFWRNLFLVVMMAYATMVPKTTPSKAVLVESLRVFENDLKKRGSIAWR